ncbi:hypothetical protein B1R94_25770 [Mycolicibacterium litorale]|nr:hypothetical protein B1R94_25770 [Mycolicibacterium litorale]
MSSESPLGDFLRWHRQRLTPADVGLPVHGRRRVSGLRREEVALLAGISMEYYVRLEQGRERNPSVAVVDSLAEALRLDADQVTHLHDLARPKSRRADLVRHTEVPDRAVALMNSLNLPAVLLNRYMDVLGANRPAQALFHNMSPGTNRLRASFLDPREREFWRDWDQAAANSVAQLRSDIGGDVESSPAHSLITELMHTCEDFQYFWSRQDVQQQAISPVRVRHPEVGDLELHREKLIVAGTDGIVMFIYYAEPDSQSAQRLAALTFSAQAWSG